jgi:3-deoxy-D-manno-octulosonate 8-phosphate phosphatase (KDO 8-P phosphatase)
MTYLDELRAKIEPHKHRLSKIKLVAFDVDGVLTNGQLHYSEQGESTKVFHVRDGVGLKLLADIGVVVVVITAKDSKMVASRMSDLGITEYMPGVKNKFNVLREVAAKHNISLGECCFVGDDMVDVKPMSESGFSFAPANAYPLVCEVASLTLTEKGGEGVARKVADYVLVAKKQFESAYQLAGSEAFERDR